MTILFFTRLFYPHIGGVEKHVLEISKRLLKKKLKIIIVTEQYDSKLKLKEVYHGITIHRIPTTQNYFKKFYIWWWLFRHRELVEKANIIHAHDVFYWFLPFKFFYFNKLVFVTFHGYESYPIKINAIIVRKISEVLSNGNMCIGDFMKKWYIAKPSIVSYGGVNIQLNHPRINNKYSALFFGRLDTQTGFLTYQKAVEIIRKKIPEFNFTIAGDGEFNNRINKKNVYLGWKEDIGKILPKFRFAFVSRYLSILEALSAKRLVIAVYDNPVKKDYLMQSIFFKYIIIVNSEEELAKKVIFFLNNPEKEKDLIERGYKFVLSQRWENTVNQYLKLWKLNKYEI